MMPDPLDELHPLLRAQALEMYKLDLEPSTRDLEFSDFISLGGAYKVVSRLGILPPTRCDRTEVV